MRIPEAILPHDGRFGSGPSLVRPAALRRLASSTVMGTSHRREPVRSLVAAIQRQLLALYRAPEGYEVLLGNGGSTAFWDAATFSLVRERASHGVFGEFSAKFAAATDSAPFLDASLVNSAPSGSCALPLPGGDVAAWPHNETSTGVLAPIHALDDGALTVVDATSAAGGVFADLSAVDVYYFAPQKAFGSDGGLWLAICSPRAIARIEEVTASRWIPEFLDLGVALRNSRSHQTLNTPALATLELLNDQLEWMHEAGGLEWAAARTRRSTDHIYAWAESREWAAPFVADRALRSPVVATVDLCGVDADEVNAALRANGVVDTFAYRKLGRNQLRVGAFPGVDPEDVARLTEAIDFVVASLQSAP